MVNNSVIQQPDIIQNQQSMDCAPGVILPSASYNSSPVRVQQQIVQQLPSGQFIQRPLSVGGGGLQNVILRQPGISQSSSAGVIRLPSIGSQFLP